MDRIEELNSSILEITLKIQERHPELYELLAEMPVTIPNIKNPLINFEALVSYYDSLRSILDTYNNNAHRSRL